MNKILKNSMTFDKIEENNWIGNEFETPDVISID